MRVDAEDSWRIAHRAVRAAGGVVTADTYRDGVDFRYVVRCSRALRGAVRLRGVLRLPAGSEPVVIITMDAGGALRRGSTAAALLAAATLLAGLLKLLGILSLAPALAAGGCLTGLAAYLGSHWAIRSVRRRVLSAVGAIGSQSRTL